MQFTTPSPARRAADHYVDMINANRFGAIEDLFASDATFLPPSGEVLKGRQEIGRFYREEAAQRIKGCRAVSFVQEGDKCVVELEPIRKVPLALPFVARAIDHFTVDAEGKICRLAIYLNPARH